MSAQAHMDIGTRRSASRLLDDDAMAILAAGARARAVADACESAGLAAVLLDGAGRVLHVGASAAAMMGPAVRVEAGHILGHDGFANAAIEAVLNPVLGNPATTTAQRSLTVVDATPDRALSIAAFSYVDDLPGQLLAAVFVLGANAGDIRARVAALGTW